MSRKKRKQRKVRTRHKVVPQRLDPDATATEMILSLRRRMLGRAFSNNRDWSEIMNSEPAGSASLVSDDRVRRASDDFDRFLQERRRKLR